jgi:nitrate reductase gamma subunit
MNEDANWKTRTIILGGLIGALTGLGMAILLVRRAEQQGEKPKLGTGEGMKIGMTLLGLLRQISGE